MSRVSWYAFSAAWVCAILAVPAHGQAVISTRSGLVHFFEGAVFVAGQPLQAQLGRFATIPEGGELRTEQGRAEVLLTPGVILRVGDRSAIRMVANALSDTRVELLAGSAMVDSSEPAAGTSVTLIYKNWNVRQAEKGAYRLDGAPPRVEVREGEVKVAAAGGDPVNVEQGMDMPLAAVLVPEKSAGESHDPLSEWTQGREESISADNAIAANIQDPASMTGMDLPADSFTYFPMLGLIGPGLAGLDPYSSLNSPPSGLYGTSGLYQTGFYSMYLPGYTYRPLFLGFPTTGIGTSLHSLYPSYRVPVPGSTLQHSLYPPYRSTLPGTSTPRFPTSRPVTPTPHIGVHPIGRR